MIINERGKADAALALWIGWMTSRLAVEREQALSGPQHYFRMFFEEGSADVDAEAFADAEFNRISRTFGIEVVDIADGEVPVS